MQMKEAVVKRFQDLCRQRGIKYNELATLSGVTPSTVYSMMDNSRKDVSVVTVKKLCDGLDIYSRAIKFAEAAEIFQKDML